MTRISSTHNPVVKYIRSLERARIRREEGAYLVEGVRLVGEAISTRQLAPLVLYDAEQLSSTAAGSFLLDSIPSWADRHYEVDGRVLHAAAQTETPAGVIAVLRLPDHAPLASHSQDRLGVILDRLADPGNAGTILRTADAAGVGFVVCLPGTVDLFSPKVVRAGMGAHFRLPLYEDISCDDIVSALPDATWITTEARSGASVYDYTWPAHGALVIGNEAHGLSPDVQNIAHESVHIPMRPGVESLNAAVAASITMYAALGPGIENR